ncbi:aminotransferase class I/II-fold pyridoxal phosphate-dependent enzyme [Candidatus Protofrankia californiensis]|uniref:aminotransferase class I/II-fold pyridoxal phosphate-dependent enzyme n=1 Tax=Candidatus Protofrankia californiensis TaxID=1839754 RepID=UPI0013EBB58E|nr:aminotransferase class I/II-fold pyridoxal phosphate-dependent enzyme [Candidatus Protofrankia californiensis]
MTDFATSAQWYFDPRVSSLAAPGRRPRPRGVLDLSRNELIHPALDPLIATLLKEVPSTAVTKYPIYSELITELADVADCSPEELEIFPGSDDAIGVIIDAFAVQSGSLILQDPTYPAYRYHAQLRGIDVLPWLPRPGELSFAAVDAVRAMERTPSTVLVVTDPHGMLGRSLGDEAMMALAAVADLHGHLLVLDQCYQAFRGEDRLQPVRGWDNIVRIGSFSQSAGLAGMRLGYVIGAPSKIDYLRRWRRAAAVSGATAWMALKLHRNRKKELDAIREDIIDGREWLAGQVAGLEKGFSPLASDANFLTVDVGEPDDARRLKDHLARNGVMVRSHEDHTGFASLLQFTAAPVSLLHQVVAALTTFDAAQ